MKRKKELIELIDSFREVREKRFKKAKAFVKALLSEGDRYGGLAVISCIGGLEKDIKYLEEYIEILEKESDKK